MRAELFSHPTTPCSALHNIVATVERVADDVRLSFTLTGRIDALKLPALQPATRTDELWQHTCFELFARARNTGAYVEFNFSPSTQWAAYRFAAYREGMQALALSTLPVISRSVGPDSFRLEVNLCRLALPARAQLAITAVIEEQSGAKSYWSIAHRIDKPDFHHEHGFVLTLD
jgi:hypothetical protein